MPFLVLLGDVIHSPVFGELELLQDQLVVVSSNEDGGKILRIASAKQRVQILVEYGRRWEDVKKLQKGQFIIPGFVDLHVHAPQYVYTGTATDTPLMQWLSKYAFKAESAMARTPIALDCYNKAVSRLLSHGTTTALYFSSIHLETTKTLVDVCKSKGQRAFIGKVCMDRNGMDDYQEATDEGVQHTQDFIRYVESLEDDTLTPVVTPRFIPTCSREMLAGLGKLVARYGVPVQSHISESFDAVHFSEALHPEVKGRDTTLFDEYGLLTHKTVMAHGVLLNEDELKVLAARGSSIAHCPLSNMYFAEKLLRVKQLLASGVNVGLGTDVAGGYSPSMLNAIRMAVLNSRAVHSSKIDAASPHNGDMRQCVPEPPHDEDIVSFKEAFWMATVGGAQALEVQDKIGSMEEGKEFDALIIDCSHGATFDAFPSDTPMDLFEKFINLGDDRNVLEVWVKGKKVK